MVDLNENEVLCRVQRYNLAREEGRLSIDVEETVAGKSPHRYHAVPKLGVGIASEDFWGVGETEQAALEDCLRRIKNVAIQVMFQPPGS